MSSVQRSMCAGMLGLQAIVLFLVGVTLSSVTDSVSPAAGVGIGLGLGALCVVGAGLVRRPAGMAFGWGIQVLSILLGFAVPVMFVVGLIFLALWAGSVYLGGRIDRERAERAALG